MRIIFATKNQHKLKEIREVFADLPYEVVSMGEIGLDIDVLENGKTFAENSRKKAREIGEYFPNDIVMADDSGLAVDILNGAPGVYSARYAGEQATYLDNNKKLMADLKGVPTNDRKAKFVCVLAYVDAQNDSQHVVRGEVSGIIIETPLGEGGFGYDPLFYVPDLGLTFAQVDPAVKNSCSHRARALQQMKAHLETLKG